MNKCIQLCVNLKSGYWIFHSPGKLESDICATLVEILKVWSEFMCGGSDWWEEGWTRTIEITWGNAGTLEVRNMWLARTDRAGKQGRVDVIGQGQLTQVRTSGREWKIATFEVKESRWDNQTERESKKIVENNLDPDLYFEVIESVVLLRKYSRCFFF